MRKYLGYIAVLALILTSCSNKENNGELYGVYSNPYQEMFPYGMVHIPGGSFTMGPNDQSSFFNTSKENKQVNIEPFWMDDTEITNAEYKQFVSWLKDYIIRLSIFQNQIGAESDFFAMQTREGDIYYLDEKNNIPVLNYDQKIDRQDPEVQEFIDTLLYFTTPFEGKGLKIENLNYTYTDINKREASKKINQLDPVTARYQLDGRTKKDAIRKDTAFMSSSRGIIRDTKYVQLRNREDFFITKSINIYPDTLCWMRNYTYSYNEPYTLYFSHPGYEEYPVVGVSWEQAQAFCHWRTKLKNDFLKKADQARVQRYRLPTEAEWEYAARGDLKSAMYPWGGPYIRRSDGCYLANFKPGKGDYIKDGYTIPAIVGTFPANNFGLFDMAGNVAEWTESAFIASSLAIVNELNPSFTYDARNDDPAIMKRKVVKGGSWKDVGAFLQCGMSTSEQQDATFPYLGFRCVRTIIN